MICKSFSFCHSFSEIVYREKSTRHDLGRYNEIHCIKRFTFLTFSVGTKIKMNVLSEEKINLGKVNTIEKDSFYTEKNNSSCKTQTTLKESFFRNHIRNTRF